MSRDKFVTKLLEVLTNRVIVVFNAGLFQEDLLGVFTVKGETRESVEGQTTDCTGWSGCEEHERIQK